MPELPEVQTIRTQLSTHLPLEIKKESYSSVHKSILKETQFRVKKLKINSIDRVGKLMIFNLNDNKFILSHLGMSGAWNISKEKITKKHAHINFECLNDSGEKIYLSYVDPRRFGNMYFYKEKSKDEFLKRLGPDIYSDEFNLDFMIKALKKFPERQIKAHLLDQKYFAGIGNYLASEICFFAGIRPTKKCKLIKKNQYEKLYNSFYEALDPSIKTGGTTFAGGYADAYGEKGEGVLNLMVFNQKECQSCGAQVKKITLKTRGTYYCPKCQS